MIKRGFHGIDRFIRKIISFAKGYRKDTHLTQIYLYYISQRRNVNNSQRQLTNQ